MSEKASTKSKGNFLQLRDVTGDLVLINLDKVNYLRVDDNVVIVLFANDPHEHKLNVFTYAEIQRLNDMRF